MATYHNAHMAAHLVAGLDFHKSSVPPAPPPPAPPALPHVVVTDVHGLLPNKKVAPKVLGMWGIPLVGRGTDAGMGIPHFSIPSGNALTPVIMLGAKSKVMFGSSTVRIQTAGKEEDCGACYFPCAPVSLNLACNDPVHFPSHLVAAPNTVEVLMTPGDFLGGLLSMAVDMGVSFVAAKVAGVISNKLQGLMPRFASLRWNTYLSEFMEEGMDKYGANMLADKALREALEKFQGTLAGAAVDHLFKEAAKKALGLGTDPVKNHLDPMAEDGICSREEGDPPVHNTDQLEASDHTRTDDASWWY